MSDSSSATQHRWPVWIFLLALFLRLVPVLLSYDLPISLDDMFQYDMLARSLVAGNGYRWYAEDDLDLIRPYVSMQVPPDYDPRGVLTSHRGPGYPAFLALIYALCGTGPQRFFFVRLAQALLGASLAPLTWLLARRLGFDARVGRWSALAMAAYPLLVLYPLALASENLFLPLLLLGLLLVLHAAERRRAALYVLAGLVLGLAVLTRSVVSGLVPLALVWLWWTAGDRRAELRRGALLVVTFLLVSVPWAVRNSWLHGRPVGVETAMGYNMYLGYHPQSTGTFDYRLSRDLLPIMDDGERDARGMAAALAFIRADPGRVPYLMLRKAGYLWGLDRRALTYFYSNGLFGRWPAWLLGLVLALDCGPLVLLAPAAAVGLACGRLTKGKALVVLLLAYYTGVHTLILAEPRFHLPLLPMVVVLAFYALVERPWRRALPGQRWLALLLVALLLFNWGAELVRDRDVLTALFGPDGHRLYLGY